MKQRKKSKGKIDWSTYRVAPKEPFELHLDTWAKRLELREEIPNQCVSTVLHLGEHFRCELEKDHENCHRRGNFLRWNGSSGFLERIAEREAFVRSLPGAAPNLSFPEPNKAPGQDVTEEN